MTDVVQVAAGFLIAQIFGAVILVAVLKADSRWIKRMLQDHETRLRRIELRQPRLPATEFDSLGV
jgi:hypothetical protein